MTVETLCLQGHHRSAAGLLTEAFLICQASRSSPTALVLIPHADLKEALGHPCVLWGEDGAFSAFCLFLHSYALLISWMLSSAKNLLSWQDLWPFFLGRSVGQGCVRALLAKKEAGMLVTNQFIERLAEFVTLGINLNFSKYSQNHCISEIIFAFRLEAVHKFCFFSGSLYVCFWCCPLWWFR